MTHIHKINPFVLLRIFRYLTEPRAEYIEEWIPRLQYLHVCSLWSDMIQPLVLCNGFIELCQRNTHHCSTVSAAEATAVIPFTNADIVIERGYLAFVKAFFISTSASVTYLDYFGHVIAVLQPDIYEWSGVYSLTIDMTSDWSKYYPSSTSDTQLVGMCSQYANQLHRCMPQVTELSILEPSFSNSLIANPLANNYMRQLVVLSSTGPIRFSLDTFCSNLTVLRVQLDPESKPLYLPHLQAAPLKNLFLSNVPRSFSWAEFYDANGPDIEFHNLEVLLFSFVNEPQVKGGKPKRTFKRTRKFIYYRLHFPKLHTLTIECCPPDSELLNCAPYFSNLRSFVTSGSIDAVALSIKLGLQKQETIKVLIDGDYTIDRQLLYTTTNYLFGKLTTTKNAYFWIDFDIGYPDLQHINWYNLTNVYFSTSIHIDVFTSLMSGLTNVATCIVDKMTIDMVYSEVDFYDIPSHNFCKNMKEMYLYYSSYSLTSVSQQSIAILHIALKLPLHNIIYVDPILTKPLIRAINQLAGICPQLLNITFQYITSLEAFDIFMHYYMFNN